MLVGRVGLVSLGQAAVLAIGAWVAARLLFATSLPFEVVLLMTGLITMVLGTLVGLPALRMSGLYLALITLMLAGAITVVLATINFPNGGHGFLGYNGGAAAHPADPPAGRSRRRTRRFFRYSVIVAALMFLLVLAHIRTRPDARGRRSARASRRRSRPGSTRRCTRCGRSRSRRSSPASPVRCWPAPTGSCTRSTSTTQDSITLLAVVLMGGIYSVWGAIVAALLLQFLPALLNSWGVSPDWLTILFGVGVLQVLTTAPRRDRRPGTARTSLGSAGCSLGLARPPPAPARAVERR